MFFNKIDAIRSHQPLLFEDFFNQGQEETLSPFLTRESRGWGINLTFKSSVIAAIFLAIAFILSFFQETRALSHLLLVIVYFLAGIPSLIEAIEDIVNFEVNIDILMTLAAFSSALIGSGMEGALLLVLFSLSGSLEDSVTAKAKSAISSLHKLSPTKASVLEANGMLIERSIKDVSVNMHILIRSGQIIPLDGIVTDGISAVNLVHLTGENLPVTKGVGDIVPAGARNLDGVLTVKVTHTSADSTLSRIIQLVTEAQEARPLLQKWFDKLSKGYAISIILLALFFALSFPFFLNLPYLGMEGSVYRGLAFLIAASPCALIIAIPIAYFSALGACANRGILLKGGVILDALAHCSMIAFDKTGTLTTGELSLTGIAKVGFEGIDQSTEDLVLSVAYSLEKNAVHPIAKAIVSYAQEKKILGLPFKEFKTIPGYGVEALVLFPEGNQEVYIGNLDYIQKKISQERADSLLVQTATVQEQGGVFAVMLLKGDIYLFQFYDTLRVKIKETLDLLKHQQQMKLVMLTGDNENSAKKIAKEVEIDQYHANLRPEDKLRYITEYAKQYGVAMIGDGINDAPALARATIGICMGQVGSTAAIDAADIVLLHDNIELLGWLIQKSRQTQRIVKQNLILASAAICLASLPALAGEIPLWTAVLLHEGGTVLVGLNGLRLLSRN